jgi:hypothetical protein
VFTRFQQKRQLDYRVAEKMQACKRNCDHIIDLRQGCLNEVVVVERKWQFKAKFCALRPGESLADTDSSPLVSARHQDWAAKRKAGDP